MLANFSWLVEGKVAGMARPGPDDAPLLRLLGVTAVLSLTVRPAEGLQGFRVCHVPVVDMEAPSLEDLERSVLFLEEVVASGGRAVVHCAAGIGRTGTVLAAFLVAGGATADEAIAAVREGRPGSIETPEQEWAVRAFERFWKEAE
jgi:atypical dual specificity phosphatase